MVVKSICYIGFHIGVVGHVPVVDNNNNHTEALEPCSPATRREFPYTNFNECYYLIVSLVRFIYPYSIDNLLFKPIKTVGPATNGRRSWYKSSYLQVPTQSIHPARHFSLFILTEEKVKYLFDRTSASLNLCPCYCLSAFHAYTFVNMSCKCEGVTKCSHYRLTDPVKTNPDEQRHTNK